jgi:DNA-binding NarL/FixJ family response regulator
MSYPEVIVIDDRLAVRRGTELLLRDSGFRIAGTADAVEVARGLLHRRRHDVALLEPAVGGGHGLSLATELLRVRRDAPLVLYTDGPALPAAAALGAPGFVLKSSPPAILAEALRTVAAGQRFQDPALAERLGAARSKVARLSPREREILELLADGLTGAQIAKQLYLSPETVRTHVRNAARKLEARTRTQAVALVAREMAV